MDDLFKPRILTAAINAIKAPSRRVYNRLFQAREHIEITDRLAFDVISGSEGVLKAIAVKAAATVTSKTNRKTVTMGKRPLRRCKACGRRFTVNKAKPKPRK